MDASYDLSVCIGRFQVFHNGQLALVRRALTLARQCVVVIGSAHQAPSPKNPFSWRERAEMIRQALPESERNRLHFVAMRDYYDQNRWVRAVQESVAAQSGGGQCNVVLVGHHKDPTSEYLNDFPSWTLEELGVQGAIDASSLRDAFFGAGQQHIDSALAALVDKAPASTLHFLRAWSQLPQYPTLAEEWKALRREKEKWAAAPYPPVLVTVDALLKCAGQVLLIKRGRPPGKGLYALPGGFLEQRETTYQSTLRELAEETGVRPLASDMAHALKDSRVFDHPDRSQRGRVITHAYYFDFGDQRPLRAQAGDDAASVEWMPIEKLPSMEECFHEDHFHILDHFLKLSDG